MSDLRRTKIEFGDFQTPRELAVSVCEKLSSLGIAPDVIIEPTCGQGAFVVAAAKAFVSVKKIYGFEINELYLDQLQEQLSTLNCPQKIQLTQADFFSMDWQNFLNEMRSGILVLGNFPWVTNSQQAISQSKNLPEKTNFQNHKGFDAISGKSNFDISEWMMLEVLKWFKVRTGDIAMLLKTSVARKILAHAERENFPVIETKVFKINAAKDFGVSVDACLLVMRIAQNSKRFEHDYEVFENLSKRIGHKMGHRNGVKVRDLEDFNKVNYLLGVAPQKWRSGMKHDASNIMELSRTIDGYRNGLGELVDVEPDILFPLMKGSDIGSNKPWHDKFVLVTQRFVGEPTDLIQWQYPKTWKYLEQNIETMNKRASIIYKNNPKFSVFGVGDYAFKPWRIAICSLYKILRFRLVPPVEGKPVMFDDTVYYLSFDSEDEANNVFKLISTKEYQQLLSSITFWDEKRPVKAGILNMLDWSKLSQNKIKNLQLV